MNATALSFLNDIMEFVFSVLKILKSRLIIRIQKIDEKDLDPESFSKIIVLLQSRGSGFKKNMYLYQLSQ